MCKVNPFWRKMGPLSGVIIFALFFGGCFAGCEKPQRVDPLVRESLAHTLEQAYPNAQGKFVLGPFGGEIGIDNLVEFDLPAGNANRKIHLIGRDFLQTEDEHTRLLTFLTEKINKPSFLATLAFPHHNPRIDSVQAETIDIVCLNGRIPAMRLHLRQGEEWRSGWLTMLPYVLHHPWLQYRMIWLLAVGDEEPAQDLLQAIANLPALQKHALIPSHDSVNFVLFGNPCHL
jgi:hypothetical protein